MKTQKYFPKDLLEFWNVHEILHILKKKVSFIGEIVGKLLTPKKVVASMSERSSFRTLLSSQSVDGCQALLKSFWHHLYHNFPLSQDRLSSLS